jgi:Fe2+ or Zn2+ uptake regulation protein
MRRLTQNRAIVLRLLKEGHPEFGLPPYSAVSVRGILKAEGVNRSIQQVHRTLNDLVDSGLVAVELRIGEEYVNHNGTLKQHVKPVRMFQIAADVAANSLEARVQELHRRVERAVVGMNWFGGIIRDGFTLEDVDAWKAELGALLAVVPGDERLGEVGGWLKCGIQKTAKNLVI